MEALPSGACVYSDSPRIQRKGNGRLGECQAGTTLRVEEVNWAFIANIACDLASYALSKTHLSRWGGLPLPQPGRPTKGPALLLRENPARLT